ncbi:MAG TPA: tetratricopeptide repeat protein [Thermoanaerobaculia bacterium]|nr:tetratricopeptide repeat protein [Thermoanaerobaculia bacterium]
MAWPALRAGGAALRAAVLAALLAAALAAAGCRGAAEPGRGARLGNEAEWTWLQAAKRQLDAERSRLDALGGPAPAPAAAGAQGALSPREQLSREVDAGALQLGRRLVAYINADPPVEGAALSARQLAAIRMESDEEIVVAHQFVARSGDYRRACEIYEAALAADPQNPRLREELARARAARYVTAERFALASPGMTGDQVRAALGPPNANDIRGYPDKGVLGWFYPKDASGAAAAVWFEKRQGQLLVYYCDWNAVGGGAAAAAATTAAPPAPPTRQERPISPTPPASPTSPTPPARQPEKPVADSDETGE